MKTLIHITLFFYNCLLITQAINKEKVYHETQGRIYSGTLAKPGEIPYQVILLSDVGSGQSFAVCGGSLISPTVILTAAHCIFQYPEYEIRLGSIDPFNLSNPNLIRMNSSSTIIHEEFDYNFGLLNDIGLLILPEPVVYTDYVQPVFLPRRSDVSLYLVSQYGRVSGWGFTNNDSDVQNLLMYADVEIIDNYYCEKSYGLDYVGPKKMCISTNNGTVGACNGDSGGPLTHIKNSDGEKILVGIVSYGSSDGCNSGYPEVYTRVTQYLDWIEINANVTIRP